MVVNQHCS